MNRPWAVGRTLLSALALALTPLFGSDERARRLMVMAVLWLYLYTCWSIMGQLGLVSFGHGAFLGIGAYTAVLLLNGAGISPWIAAHQWRS